MDSARASHGVVASRGRGVLPDPLRVLWRVGVVEADEVELAVWRWTPTHRCWQRHLMLGDQRAVQHPPRAGG